jgi:hypothetical protein
VRQGRTLLLLMSSTLAFCAAADAQNAADRHAESPAFNRSDVQREAAANRATPADEAVQNHAPLRSISAHLSPVKHFFGQVQMVKPKTATPIVAVGSHVSPANGGVVTNADLAHGLNLQAGLHPSGEIPGPVRTGAWLAPGRHDVLSLSGNAVERRPSRLTILGGLIGKDNGSRTIALNGMAIERRR